MSILLNALNKSNSEQASTEALDELIDAPVKAGSEDEPATDASVNDATIQNENQKKKGIIAGSSVNMTAIMLGFLSLIVVLLLIIVFLLLRQTDTSTVTHEQPLTQQLDQNQQPKQSRQPEQSPQPKQSRQSSINQLPNNKSGVMLSENSVTAEPNTMPSERSSSTAPTTSTSVTSNHSTSNSDDRYYESFKPEKQPVERITEAEASSGPSQATNTEAAQNRDAQLVSQPSNASPSHPPQINKALPIKDIEQLTQIEQLMVNEITLDAHVYSEEASQRFIFVNDALIQEGEKIINSWYLESIEPDGIVVNNGVLRVNLEKQ